MRVRSSFWSRRMGDLFSLAGKSALITGGSRGIGAMIAKGFVQAGVRTYISARKADALEATAMALSEYGSCTPLGADLSTVEGTSELTSNLAAHEDKLDILVNNAGATWGSPIDDFPESGWDRVVDLNLKGVFFLTQKCLPLLRSAASMESPARIINISSINAFRHSHMDNFSYSASKAGVITLTEHLAASLAQDHITVNAIAPGMFPSKMTAFLYSSEDRKAQTDALVPLGRSGAWEDAAGPAMFLASRAAAFMTGATLTVDGGVAANA